MKYKIVSATLMIILMIASIFAGASSVNIKSINKDSTEKDSIVGCSFIDGDQAEKPEWHVGHFWEYEGNIIIDLDVLNELGSVEAASSFDKVIVEVAEADDNEYVLTMNGAATGILEFQRSLRGPLQEISGYIHMQKDSLAIKEYSITFTGMIYGFEVDFYIILKFNPAIDFFDFPIVEDEEPWNAETTCSMIVGGKGPDFVGEFVYEDLDDQTIETTISLEGAQDVTVPAGTFHSFLLSESFGSQSEICYAPEIAFIVSLNEKFALDISQFGTTAGDLTNEYEMNLVKTNYDLDNNPPNKPGKPTVVDGGSTPGKEYTFKTSAIEPDGEQIYYWWDWDDGSEDKWLGPFSSGEYCKASHTWGEQGSYNIRVRAKDEHDCETAWSDPLPVSMPKSKSVNLLHITFLQRLVNRFPFLEQLLDL